MKNDNDINRLDHLIDEIDQGHVVKRRRNVILFGLLIGVMAFTSYLSFSQNSSALAAQSESPTIGDDIPIDKINAAPNKEDQLSVLPVGIQSNIEEPDHETVGTNNVGAQFPGGSNGVAQYLKEHIEYPDLAFDKEIEGKVLVQVTIDETGEVSSPIIVEGLGYGCDEEVIRVLSNMPIWQPAKVNNVPVKKSYILTVTFSLS